MPNPFQTLGISEDSTPDQVKDAWRDYARKTHPDAGGNADEFRAGHAAYQAAMRIAQTPKKCPKCGGSGRDKLRSGFYELDMLCRPCRGTGFETVL